jgi:phosphohistidine phosphatase
LKRLTLMRHANAQWKDPQISDFDRPLNRRGLSEAEAMGRRLLELQLIPASLLSSNARRAEQTVEIVARELGVSVRNIRTDEALYLAPADEILRIIRSTGPRISHLMIVGHNPGLSEVANLLAPNRDIGDLTTGAACSFTFDANSWADVEAAKLHDSLNETPPVGLFALWA